MYLVSDIHIDKNTSLNIKKQIALLEEIASKAKKTKEPVLILGDLFDKRTSVSTPAINATIDFFNTALAKSVTWHVLVGNHDMFYKNRTDITSVAILKAFKNIHVYTEQTYITIEDKKALIVPWLNDETQITLKELIKENKPDVIMAHLELAGFLVTKNYAMKHGQEFDVTDIPVFTGHYHTAQRNNNIQYLGSPLQYTWSEFGQRHGYWHIPKDSQDLLQDATMIEPKEKITHVKVTLSANAGKIDIIIDDGINNHVKLGATKAQAQKLIKANIDETMRVKIMITEYKAIIKATIETIATIDKNARVEIITHKEVIETISHHRELTEEEQQMKNAQEQQVNILQESGKSIKELMLDNVDEQYQPLLQELFTSIDENS